MTDYGLDSAGMIFADVDQTLSDFVAAQIDAYRFPAVDDTSLDATVDNE